MFDNKTNDTAETTFITHEDDYEVTTKNHGKVTVPAGTLEFPQVADIANAIIFSGGEDKLVALFNDTVYARSKNGALALVRNAAADAVIDETIQRAAQYAKTYNPAAERVSKQAVLDGVAQLSAMKDQLSGMSQEQLLELLNKTLKL